MRGKVNARPSAVRALLVIGLLLAVAGTASARFGFPEPLTDRGRLVEDIYSKIAIAGIITFVLVFVLLVVILVRFRESTGKGRATHEKHRGSLAAEMTWTLVPLAVVLWVGYIAYAGLVTLDKGNEDLQPEMAVTVTGVQWAWQMDYSDNVTVLVSATPDAKGNLSFSDTFHLPADTPIKMDLTGGDVIHAFNVLDANRAYFFMEDANPGGPHKVHSQVVAFPAGKYEIQCKEMCSNPGHGYMRGQIVVESKEQFARWFEERRLAAGATLLQRTTIVADATSLKADTGNQTTGVTEIGKGARVLLNVENKGNAPLDIRLPDGRNHTVAPGQSDVMAFNTAVAGDFTVTASNGGRLIFRAVEAKVVDIDLRSYVIAPSVAKFEKGQAYLINVHAADSIHNYYIGHWDGTQNGQKTIVKNSPTVNGGKTASFLWTPDESGTFDAWCDITGHYGSGMHATATVS